MPRRAEILGKHGHREGREHVVNARAVGIACDNAVQVGAGGNYAVIERIVSLRVIDGHTEARVLSVGNFRGRTNAVRVASRLCATHDAPKRRTDAISNCRIVID